MESTARIGNTRPTKFEILVNYMSTQPDLPKGYLKTADARKKSHHSWENLANELNADGPPMRDGVGWKKVWADFKVHTKAKIRRNKMTISGTGVGPSKHSILSPIEEKVVELLDLRETVDEMSGTLSFGVNQSSESSHSADLV